MAEENLIITCVPSLVVAEGADQSTVSLRISSLSLHGRGRIEMGRFHYRVDLGRRDVEGAAIPVRR